MEKLYFFPLFYCIICEKELNYDKALEHLEKNKTSHEHNCIISEEIMNLQKDEMIYNLVILLEKRNDELTEEESEIDKILSNMNVFKIYLNQDLIKIKNNFLQIKKTLNKYLEENEKIKEQINIIKNKKEQGLKSKYKNLKDFELIYNQLINTYFSKDSIKQIKEDINNKKIGIQKLIISIFNTCNCDIYLNNNFIDFNRKNYLKTELNKLKIDELKIINEKLDDNDNANNSDIFKMIILINMFNINIAETNNFL